MHSDYDAVAKRVTQLAHRDVAAMGLTIISYVVKSVSDSNGYIGAKQV